MEDGELITFGQGASGRLGTGKMAKRFVHLPFPLAPVVRFSDRSQQESQVARQPWISRFCYQVEAL